MLAIAIAGTTSDPHIQSVLSILYQWLVNYSLRLHFTLTKLTPVVYNSNLVQHRTVDSAHVDASYVCKCKAHPSLRDQCRNINNMIPR